ncbi:MAG: helix-turn-helix transcriptional regulator [Lachnospiraceae bacterium]|nr:helix-turn-helix transcriptional regulator [Lachnospiraceae bacterium]
MIGTKLKALRQQNHLSQEKLAEKLGVSRNTVSKWESDVCDPDIENLKALCQYFQRDVAYFLGQPQRDAAVHGDADVRGVEKQPLRSGGFFDHWMEVLLFAEIVFFLGLYILSWVVPSREEVTRRGQAPVSAVSSLTGTEESAEGNSDVSADGDTGQETDADQKTAADQESEVTYSYYIDTKGFFPFMSTYHLWPVALIVAADAVVNVILIVRKRMSNREKFTQKAAE